MKKKLFKTKIALVATVSLIFGLLTPYFSSTANASGNVAFESTLNVANVTAGDTTYKPTVNAKVDDVVKLEIFYHNKEAENSGILAHNVNVKIAVPTDTSKSHVFTSTVSGSDIDTFVRNATVNTEINTKMIYIPGSAYRRHDIGTNQNPNWVTEKIPDSVTTSGFNIPEMKPCFNFQETITILARVTAPVVSIKKQVKIEGTNEWKTEIDAKPGDKLAYMITFKNEGNVKLNDLVIRDSFPKDLDYMEGSAKLIDSLFPNGLAISDNLINGGVILGNYNPGSGGYVRFNAMVPDKINIEGCKVETNVGVVKAKEIGEFFNTANVKVCVEKKIVPPTPVTPATTVTEVTTPVPTTLPVSGAEQAIMGTVGGISLLGAGAYYRRGRKALKNAFRLFK